MCIFHMMHCVGRWCCKWSFYLNDNKYAFWYSFLCRSCWVVVDKKAISGALNKHICAVAEAIKSEQPDCGDIYIYIIYVRNACQQDSLFFNISTNELVKMISNLISDTCITGKRLVLTVFWGKIIQLRPKIFADNSTRISFRHNEVV